MQRIISLDIGSYSIKALEIINTFTSVSFNNLFELKISPEINADDSWMFIPPAVAQLFKDNNIEADQVICAMPGQHITYRILSFNYSDPRKIDLTIRPRLEEQLPFDLDTMIISHQILGTDAEQTDKTYVLTVATKKEFVGRFLEELKSYDIDPKLIDVDSVALYNLNNRIEHPAHECYAIFDIGHSKSSLCIVQNHQLKFFRTIYIGGKHLTDLIAQELSLSFEEAELLKHRVSQIGIPDPDNNSLDNIEIQCAERIMVGIDALINEMVRTIFSFKMYERAPITKFYLSGGSSKLKNSCSYLSAFIGVPVELMDLLNAEHDNTETLTKHAHKIPQSIALGMRVVSTTGNHSKINLRRNEFSYSQNYQEMFSKTALIAKVAAIFFLVLTVNYVAKYFIYAQKSEEINKQIHKQIRATIPAQDKRLYKKFRKRPSRYHREVIKTLQNEIQNKENAQDEIRMTLNESTALEVIASISQAIKDDVKIDTDHIRFNTGNIELKADTDSFESATKIAAYLEDSGTFSSVKEVKSFKKPGNADVITFELSLKLKQ